MKNKPVSLIVVVVLMVGAWWVGRVTAGSLDAPTAPGSTSSYGLDDIYNRLDTGAAGTSSNFAEPGSGPGSTMMTLNEIMGKAPAPDNTNGATTTQVINGTTFWGLTSGQWGVQTGTLEIAASAPCDCAGGTMTGTRWCDNGDGTVTDLLGDSTNSNVGQCLVWLKNANCADTLATIAGGANNWGDAIIWSSAVSSGSCSLNDGSGDGIWRLPTREELDGITNGTDQVRSGNMQAFTDVQAALYWSSTTLTLKGVGADLARNVDMEDGDVNFADKSSIDQVWAVRGGQ